MNYSVGMGEVQRTRQFSQKRLNLFRPDPPPRHGRFESLGANVLSCDEGFIILVNNIEHWQNVGVSQSESPPAGVEKCLTAVLPCFASRLGLGYKLPDCHQTIARLGQINDAGNAGAETLN